jgi:hypothetical protein
MLPPEPAGVGPTPVFAAGSILACPGVGKLSDCRHSAAHAS